MTTAVSKWIVPVVGLILGILIVAASLRANASPAEAIVGFVVVLGYAIAIRILQSRSETVSLLAGLPVDERWASINLHALSIAAQVVAVVLVVAFLAARFTNGDAMPYAYIGVVFAAAYLGAIGWYRWRS